jgi:hypothetical protein
MPFPAFCGENVAVFDCKFIAWGQHGFIEEHLLNPYIESVPWGIFARRCVGVSVEEDFGADVLERLVEQPAVGENRVERVNVRSDGSCEHRIGCAVLGRALEEVLPARSVEFCGPLRVGCGGRHSCGVYPTPGSGRRGETEKSGRSQLVLLYHLRPRGWAQGTASCVWRDV